MYFQRIETDAAHARHVNDNLKAAAARRLGDYQRSHGIIDSAKRASLAWNVERKVANGANRGTK